MSFDHSQLLAFQQAPIPMAPVTFDSQLHNVMASSTTIPNNINIFNTSRMMTAQDQLPTLFPVAAATANSYHHNIGTTSHSAH
jgi:hypothetical protein